MLHHNLKKIAKALFKHRVSDLIIIHLPERAYLSSKDGLEIIQPFLQLPDDFTIGKIGAGDSFCAGVLYGLYQGWSDDKTVRFSVCAGAMNLNALTTSGGIKPCMEIFGTEERFPLQKGCFLAFSSGANQRMGLLLGATRHSEPEI